MNRFGTAIATAAFLVGGMVHAARAEDTTSADKTFIADSAQDSLSEINFAKLALQKSTDPNIRKFATQMIKDHETLITSMKPLARKYHVDMPSGPSVLSRAKYQELKLQSGTSFDRAYVEKMVSDHHDDLTKFRDEEAKTSNADVKAAVAKGGAVIEKHTKMIDDIAQQGGIKTPANS